jgi:hypothetical protein
MEAYKTVITPDTSLILSTDSRFLHYLKSAEEKSDEVRPGTVVSDPLKNLPSLLDMVKQ